MNAAHRSLTKLTRGSWSLSPGTSIQFIWMAPGSPGQHGVSRSSTMTPGLLHDSPRTCHVHSHGWMTQGHKEISRFAGHEGLLLPWVSDKKKGNFFFFLIVIIKRKLGLIQNGSAFLSGKLCSQKLFFYLGLGQKIQHPAPFWSEWLTGPSWRVAWGRPWQWCWCRLRSSPLSSCPAWWSPRPSGCWVWSPGAAWTCRSERSPQAEECRCAFQTLERIK